ncbi:hypothetical protein [Nonomuraea guangzhouensis]|uniref:hypothetical protein n=1 Tax=Nonomuraea guangzhouensis TaxID=1291555 RepID=UPI001C5E0673|nr:hypothetical protein [Nonomuraea guangzhouensis]
MCPEFDGDPPTGSWTMPMDVRRVPTCGNANEIAAGQIGDLLGRLEEAGPDPQGACPSGRRRRCSCSTSPTARST